MIHHRHGFRQQSARIAAQIEHQPLQVVLVQRLHAVFELAARCLVELFDPDIPDPRLQRENLRHALPADLVANDVEDHRLFHAFARYFDLHRGAFRPLQQVGDFRRIQTFSQLVVHFDDDVARPQTGFIRRRTDKRRNHNRLAVPALHLHADAVIMPALVFSQPFEVLGRKEVGVRIERAQHARNGAFIDGLVRAHRVGVILLDRRVHARERLHARLDVVVGRRCGSDLHFRSIDAADQRAHQNQQGGKEKRAAFLRHSRFGPSLVGSITVQTRAEPAGYGSMLRIGSLTG